MTNAAEWLNSGEFLDIDELRVFRRRSVESDSATLLLHGFPTSSFDFRKVWEALGDRFPLIAFDMIGYGYSSKPADFAYTTFRQADILESALGLSGIRQVDILAHDYGNTITQEFLARRDEDRLPFAIRSICFLNGALFPETHRPILAQRILISPVGFLFAKLLSDGRFKSSLGSVFGAETRPSEVELAEMLALFKHNGGKRVAHLLIRYMAERARYRDRWVPPLSRIGVPFRFVNGLADPVSGRHLVERFREVVPAETDIVELPGIGHFPQLESPESVIGAYLEFRDSG
jgi:pimeloyl-ACP methyl ester carboxylesterase